MMRNLTNDDHLVAMIFPSLGLVSAAVRVLRLESRARTKACFLTMLSMSDRPEQ
jgi:hypothetical protein